jgi:hypothetical protein
VFEALWVSAHRIAVKKPRREQAAEYQRGTLGPDGLAAIYRINEACAVPNPTIIGLFDDVLVTGASFRAGKSILAARFPGVKIYGVFLARRALPADLPAVE